MDTLVLWFRGKEMTKRLRDVIINRSTFQDKGTFSCFRHCVIVVFLINYI